MQTKPLLTIATKTIVTKTIATQTTATTTITTQLTPVIALTVAGAEPYATAAFREKA
jgi:hypothetical protein